MSADSSSSSSPPPATSAAELAESSHPLRQLGFWTMTLLVVANMIGVGVFITPGYMMNGLRSGPAILVAWVLMGVVSLWGALAYAELGAAFPHNGGEYPLLSRIYHPAVGFTAGIATVVAGFAMPLAGFAIKFGTDLQQEFWTGADPKWAGAAVIIIFSILHALHVGWGSRFQNTFTCGKILLILIFLAGGFMLGHTSYLHDEKARPLAEVLFSGAFASQLVYVSYAYSGWNVGAYVAGEVRRPERTLPWGLIAGTLIVTLLYVGLNWVYIISTSVDNLAQSKDKVATVAATSLFGSNGGLWISLVIMLGLIPTIGSGVMAGSRIYEAMGRNYRFFSLFTLRHSGGGPVPAIIVQALLSILILSIGTLKEVVETVSYTLSFFATLAVIGVIVLRIREPQLPRPYRMWGYPVTPVLFVLVQCWMFIAAWFDPLDNYSKAKSMVISLATIVIGIVLYLIAVKVQGTVKNETPFSHG